MHCWLSDSLRRYYPASPAEASPTLALHAARGERVAFQVLVRTEDAVRDVSVAVTGALPAHIRRVGYVPMPHLNGDTPLAEIEGAAFLPGWAPDPLFPEQTVQAGPHETNAFWVTVRTSAQMEPGDYPLTVVVTAEGAEPQHLHALVHLHRAVLPARRNFPVTHWFYADALLDWYKVEPFTEEFWRILAPYLADLAEHGQDTVYVPIFTPPLDGVKRPTQLLHVTREGEAYRFDWTQVRRWIATARAQGITHFEWTHLFTQWGVQHAIRIYRGHGEDGALLWPPETGATSDVYREFLAQFLPAFHRFLEDEGLLDVSFFHVSDEPHGEEHVANYRAARDLLRDLAPWMRVMDALSDIAYARQGLTDTPVPSITVAPDFIREGFPAWAYFCCGPRQEYLNRLLDTPLAKIRMSGWLFYRTRVHGFLHWGYNYWYESQTQRLIDPFRTADGLRWPHWPYGDTFLVYPDADGPIDSLRWEVFADSLQDYALLQAAGVDPDAPLLDAIQDYAHFPRDAAWIRARRLDVLALLDAHA